MTVQFVELGGQKMALLPESEYHRLVDAAEDNADIAAAISAQQRAAGGEEYLPQALVERLVGGEPPLLVWRTYRGLSQAELAGRAGVGAAMIAGIEAGQGTAADVDAARLAAALQVDPDDLIPLAP